MNKINLLRQEEKNKHRISPNNIKLSLIAALMLIWSGVSSVAAQDAQVTVSETSYPSNIEPQKDVKDTLKISNYEVMLYKNIKKALAKTDTITQLPMIIEYSDEDKKKYKHLPSEVDIFPRNAVNASEMYLLIGHRWFKITPEKRTILGKSVEGKINTIAIDDKNLVLEIKYGIIPTFTRELDKDWKLPSIIMKLWLASEGEVPANILKWTITEEVSQDQIKLFEVEKKIITDKTKKK